LLDWEQYRKKCQDQLESDAGTGNKITKNRTKGEKTAFLLHSTGTAGGRDGLDPVDAPEPGAADEGGGSGVGETLDGALDGPPKIMLPIPFEKPPGPASMGGRGNVGRLFTLLLLWLDAPVCEAFGAVMEFLDRGCVRIDEDGGLGGGETPLEAGGGRRLCIGDILPACFFDDDVCEREGDEGRRLVVAGGRGVRRELELVGGGGRVR